MGPFFKKILKNKRKDVISIVSQDLFNHYKEMIKLSSELTEKQRNLSNKEYDLLLKNKNDVFLSLGDFLDLMEIDNLSIKDVISRCKHSSELFPSQSSSIIVHSIIEGDHIILCKDIENCAQHKDSIANKIKITTIKLVD